MQGVAKVPDLALVHNFSMTWTNTEELWPSPRAGTNSLILLLGSKALGEWRKKNSFSPDQWGKISISPRLVGTERPERCAWRTRCEAVVSTKGKRASNYYWTLPCLVQGWKRSTLFSLVCERGSAPFALSRHRLGRRLKMSLSRCPRSQGPHGIPLAAGFVLAPHRPVVVSQLSLTPPLEKLQKKLNMQYLFSDIFPLIKQ